MTLYQTGVLPDLTTSDEEEINTVTEADLYKYFTKAKLREVGPYELLRLKAQCSNYKMMDHMGDYLVFYYNIYK